MSRAVRFIIALLFIYTGVGSALLLAGVELPFAISVYKSEPDSPGRLVIQAVIAVALVAFGLADLFRIKRRIQNP